MHVIFLFYQHIVAETANELPTQHSIDRSHYVGTEELGELPFGLKMEEYLDYATTQFSKRLARIERATEQTLEQLYQLPESEGAEGI